MAEDYPFAPGGKVGAAGSLACFCLDEFDHIIKGQVMGDGNLAPVGKSDDGAV